MYILLFYDLQKKITFIKVKNKRNDYLFLNKNVFMLHLLDLTKQKTVKISNLIKNFTNNLHNDSVS